MSKTLIFGHKSPDTDTICSAIAYAYLKNEIGTEAEAVCLGELNKETEFALQSFGQEAPREIDRVADEPVILVDHNEFQQSVSNIAEANIKEVIDHHRIANFETKDPILFRAEPVGCTATILNKIFKENQVTIPKNIAGLLLSAIISDSLLLKSPTCTDEDVAAAKELAKLAEVDLEAYGLDLLKAGADLSDKTVETLISMDAKEFTMHDHKVEIAQVNAVDIENVLEKQADITTAIEKTIDEKELDLFVFVVTDILNNNSEVLALGKHQDKVEKAFTVTLHHNRAFLEGVVSRKKQIVTNLTEAFA
ncbi:MAG TPA: manganese-dependent inorganic pyrophosphatase [Candidatus Avamphibacillus intestinigallinarum]|nr:manganese-dependent inorganic pyrophosphatase [Candidatus Avamphibacillus intestinigallinarum]